MTSRPALRLSLALLALSTGGCSAGCMTSDLKLARLTPGMSYEDVSAAMGCQGRLVRGSMDAGNAYAIAEWAGPHSRLLSQTDMMFFNRRLLWYDSAPAPGF
jgi:hypothetical protein